MWRDPRRRRIFLHHLASWLWSDRWRNALSVTGLVVGIAGITILLSVVLGEQRDYVEEMDLVGARTLVVTVDGGSMPRVHEGSLRLEVPSVTAVASASVLDAEVRPERGDPTTLPLVAAGESFFDLFEGPILRGRTLTPLDHRLGRGVAVLGKSAAESLGFPERILMEGDLLEVVGVVAGATEGAVETPIATTLAGRAVIVPDSFRPGRWQGAHATENLLIAVRSEKEIEHARRRLAEVLAPRTTGELRVTTPRELLRRARSTRRHLAVTLGVFSVLALVLGGLSLLNNMLAVVLERVEEIGVRLAMGATPREIGGQFLAEAIAISVGGILLGELTGGLGVAVLGLSGFEVELSWAIVVLPALLGLLIGAGSGFFPALRAARQSPREALTFR